jgi:hypothetical protein
MPAIPFGTGSYRLRSLPLSAQRLVNCYLEQAPPQAKTFAAVVPAYGIKPYLTVGSGNARGAIVVNGTLYAVIGETLYRIPETGVPVALGNVPGSVYVDMAGDESHLMLVTHKLGYYWNGSTVQQIPDPDFPGAEWVEELDGYFIIGEPESGKFFISGNRMPESWDALDFASAERYPDDLVGAIANLGELILFGRESFEIWSNTGNADFPFEQVGNGIGEIGMLSRYAVVKAANVVIFVGHDGKVYQLNGYTPQIISIPGIEQIIEDSADKTCFSMTWSEGGHKFVAFSFDSGTIVYDLSIQLWHERRSLGFDRWRPLAILRCYDAWFVLDFYTNRIGTLDAETFKEWDDILWCSATSPPVTSENRRMVHQRLELVFEQGVGIPQGQGSDPQVMLDWSDDGGRSWSAQRFRSMGKIGEYRRRTVWNQLGQARDRVYRYQVSDPVRRTLILATTEAATGNY